MGGEHEVEWHNIDCDCHYYDDKRDELLDVKQSQYDINIWLKIQHEIIRYMKMCLCKIRSEVDSNTISKDNYEINSITEYIKNISQIKEPQQLKLYWHYKDDDYDKLFGAVMHDITDLLIIAYPGKFCYSFERCSAKHNDRDD